MFSLSYLPLCDSVVCYHHVLRSLLFNDFKLYNLSIGYHYIIDMIKMVSCLLCLDQTIFIECPIKYI